MGELGPLRIVSYDIENGGQVDQRVDMDDIKAPWYLKSTKEARPAHAASPSWRHVLASFGPAGPIALFAVMGIFMVACAAIGSIEGRNRSEAEVALAVNSDDAEGME